MSEKLECKRCDRLFTSEEAPIGKCPNCNGTVKYLSASKPQKKSSKAGRNSEEAEDSNVSSSSNPESRAGRNSWNPDVVKDRVSRNSWAPESSNAYSVKDATLRDLVEAQNKTTHAVRSLAVFLFTTLCTSLLGYGLVGAGQDASSETMVLWGWVIIVTGFVLGLVAGIGELNRSRP